ncbi:MAG: ABC transporter permease [Oscillochloris sp.]|nr:ABC transporter permease [Oscillochloris sp.]
MSMIDSQQATQIPKVPTESSRPTIVIEPSKGLISLRLGDLWEYRELFFFLIWRDVKVRYKQTVLGASWAIIQPVVQLVIFSIIFGRLAQIDSGDIPYPLFSIAGLLPWQYFSGAISQSANSLVNNAAMVRKVYFPRATVPASSAMAGLVDFSLAFIVLIGLMLWYRWSITLNVIVLPLFIALAMITALGVGFWLSALNAQYRDIRHATPFLVQVWLFATPIVYPSDLLSEGWRLVYALNPMVGVVEGFRWALLGTNPPSTMILISATVSILLFITGLAYFQSMERKFADVI